MDEDDVAREIAQIQNCQLSSEVKSMLLSSYSTDDIVLALEINQPISSPDADKSEEKLEQAKEAGDAIQDHESPSLIPSPQQPKAKHAVDPSTEEKPLFEDDVQHHSKNSTHIEVEQQAMHSNPLQKGKDHDPEENTKVNRDHKLINIDEASEMIEEPLSQENQQPKENVALGSKMNLKEKSDSVNGTEKYITFPQTDTSSSSSEIDPEEIAVETDIKASTQNGSTESRRFLLVFAGIVDRVVQKMKDWKDKTLSQAGKEVLIKAVIQAIPSYSMNCFLLPITTCQEIEKATARFFWGSTIEDRKCHWAGWDILTTSKAQGGIGFRELHWFNLAMLAKQLWNLSLHTESTTFQLLKAKYFPRGELLHAGIGYRPSFLWRSLIAAKELIQEGIAWRIGNGKKIKVAQDRWIGVENPQCPDEITTEEIKTAQVEYLIDKDNGKWKEDMVVANFSPHNVKQILAVPLSQNPPEDRQIWRFTKHGFFTVKTAYQIAVNKFSQIHNNRPSTSSPAGEWKKIWRIKVTPRIRLFLWRISADILPTKMNLCRRGCPVDPICVLCGEEQETTNHLFMKCKVVSKVWYECSLRIDMKREPHERFRDLLWHRMATYPSEYVEILAITAWEIWKGRNSQCFEKKLFDAHKISSRAYMQWNYLVESRSRSAVTERSPMHNKKWKRPIQGGFKLNCDVAVGQNGCIGMGFVLRDERGQVILAGKKETRAEGSSTLLEAMAMRYGMQMVSQYHLRADIVEGDNKICMDGLNGNCRVDLYCDVLFQDIKATAVGIKCKSYVYIPREGNGAAHAAAHGPDFLSYRHCPNHIRVQIDKDVIE